MNNSWTGGYPPQYGRKFADKPFDPENPFHAHERDLRAQQAEPTRDVKVTIKRSRTWSKSRK